jgi:hypothetical protein
LIKRFVPCSGESTLREPQNISSLFKAIRAVIREPLGGSFHDNGVGKPADDSFREKIGRWVESKEIRYNSP